MGLTLEQMPGHANNQPANQDAPPVAWTGPERRQEPRVSVNFQGRLKRLDPITSVGPPHDVQVLDSSKGGVKIRTPRSLIPNTLVQVHFNGTATLGKVKYCIKADSGYFAGVQWVQDFPT
jgi:hypothetical protein